MGWCGSRESRTGRPTYSFFGVKRHHAWAKGEALGFYVDDFFSGTVRDGEMVRGRGGDERLGTPSLHVFHPRRYLPLVMDPKCLGGLCFYSHFLSLGNL